MSIIYYIQRVTNEGGLGAIPGFLAFISFIEVVIASITGSVCCSSFGPSKVS